jgi:DNA-binding transcriptional MerR regulator
MRVAMRAFSVEEACALTGLSRRQLSCWDRRGLPNPDYVFQDRRVYTFRDLLLLRTLALLRSDYSLQVVREVNVELARRGAGAKLAQVGVYRTHAGLRVAAAAEGRPARSTKLLDLGRIARQLARDIRHSRQMQRAAQDSSTRS